MMSTWSASRKSRHDARPALFDFRRRGSSEHHDFARPLALLQHSAGNLAVQRRRLAAAFGPTAHFAGNAAGRNSHGPKLGVDAVEAPPIVDEVRRSPGEPLDESTRHFMEARFARDFSGVRVHKDTRAARSARAVNARAYTVGHDIAFAEGQYGVHAPEKRRLLAHELAHVAQQHPQSTSRPPATTSIQRQEDAGDATTVVRSAVLKAPPPFKQNELTCWAAAIASWLLVKGIVKQGFSDQYLIDSYKGTSCVDGSGALVGVDAIQDVFAEWRLAIDMGKAITQDGLHAETVEGLLRQHGHFILGTGSGTLHAIVVYGIEVHSEDDALSYSLFVMDPILGVTETKHHMFLDYPVRVAIGLPRSGGPAPCRSQ